MSKEVKNRKAFKKSGFSHFGICDRDVKSLKDVAQDFERRQGAGGGVLVFEQVVECELEAAGRKVFELGVNFETDEVADYEERRVVETFMVLIELFVRILEVAAFGFVLPGEEAALPDIGEALFAGAGLGNALFEGVAGADLIVLRGVGDVEDFAEVAEVLRGGGALGESARVPLAHEVQEIDGHRACGYCARWG